MSNLTDLQKKAFDLMVKRENVFITGPSGTGKSMVIFLYKNLYESQRNIAITSTTGVSALLINGTTLHSYLGLGLGKESVKDLTDKILKNPKLKKKWIELDTLIIDEISMLSPELFDKIENIGRNIRQPLSLLNKTFTKQSPFGGIHIVVSGDLLQLPVVGSDKFIFEADCWNTCIPNIIYLKEIMRQTDLDFQEALNDVRYGNFSKKTKKLLLDCVDKNLENKVGIKPTKIYSTNFSVDETNEKELDKIASLDSETDFYKYEMEILIYENSKDKNLLIEKYKKNCIAPTEIELCKNAQVMLLYNIDLEYGLANGSRGVVIDFINDFPLVKFINGEERIIDYHKWDIKEDGKIIASIKQIPLKLAWAITCHKSQGCTLDYAEVDMDNIFTYGQAYVALSRVKNKEGLCIRNINFSNIKADPKALEFYKKIL
jgi:ATP-dependent DNA helicase PIF1